MVECQITIVINCVHQSTLLDQKVTALHTVNRIHQASYPAIVQPVYIGTFLDEKSHNVDVGLAFSDFLTGRWRHLHVALVSSPLQACWQLRCRTEVSPAHESVHLSRPRSHIDAMSAQHSFKRKLTNEAWPWNEALNSSVQPLLFLKWDTAARSLLLSFCTRSLVSSSWSFCISVSQRKAWRRSRLL